MDEQRAKARAAWAGSGEAATETIWFDVRERVGATEFLGYDTERAEGKVIAIIVDGKDAECAGGRPDRLADRQPDAVLRRVRRPDRRYRPLRRRQRRGRDRRHAQDGRRPACPSRARSRAARSRSATTCVMTRRRDPPAPAARASFGDASAARGAAPPSRHARHAEGLAGRARPAALRHQPHQADLGRASCARSRTRSTRASG